jgi:hypothetical protein
MLIFVRGGKGLIKGFLKLFQRDRESSARQSSANAASGCHTQFSVETQTTDSKSIAGS